MPSYSSDTPLQGRDDFVYVFDVRNSSILEPDGTGTGGGKPRVLV
jgi:hypothetical protein